MNELLVRKKKKRSLLWEVQYKINQVRWFYWDVYNGLRSLIYWVPVIWKWRSWDYAYTLRVLNHSLSALEKAIRGGYAVNAEEKARDIRVAIELIKRLEDEEHDPYYKRHRQYWELLSKLFSRKLLTWWD